MSRVTSLEASCERVTEDKVFKTREVYKGTAKYLKGSGPGLTSRASLHLSRADNLRGRPLAGFSTLGMLSFRTLSTVARPTPSCKAILRAEMPVLSSCMMLLRVSKGSFFMVS